MGSGIAFPAGGASPRVRRWGALLALAATIVLSTAQAAPGQLDAAFADAGVLLSPIGPSGARPSVVIALPDGKVLVGGDVLSNAQGVVSQPVPQFVVARFHGDGTLDTSFGVQGHTPPTSFATQGRATAMAVQADGRILVAGEAGASNVPVMAVARFNADGSIDPTFGEITIAIPGTASGAAAVAVQPDGRILLGGFSRSGLDDRFALARLNANGTPDTTFNGTGQVVIPIGTDARATSMQLQPDGKIVLGGYALATSYDFALARVNANGTLDSGFGCATPGTCAGTATLDFVGQSGDLAYASALLPDGRIVLAGYGGSTGECAIARFGANGTLDTAFGFLGRVVVPSVGSCQQVVPQPDQKLLLRGGMMLVRLHGGGLADASFGNGDGVQPMQYAPLAIALGGGGDVLVAGQRRYSLSEHFTQTAFLVTRLLPGGLPDPAFAGGAGAELRLEHGAHVAWHAVAVQDDGRIVAAGHAIGEQELQRAGFVARYLPNGVPDPAFGQGKGWVLTPTAIEIEGLELMDDGRMWVAGNRDAQFGPPIVVHRLGADGALDMTLRNGAGRVELGSNGDRVNAIATRVDGFLLLAGTTAGGDFRLEYVQPEFGSTPIAIDMGNNDTAFAIARRSDDRLYLAGSSSALMSVAAYELGSGLDPTFDGNGRLNIAFGTSATVRGIAVQPDSRIVLAGTSTTASPVVTVVRLNASGTLDTGFSGDGVATTDLPGGAADRVGAVLVQADGRILVGASTDTSFAVVRYFSNGQPDTTFNGTGTLMIPLGRPAQLNAMAMQPDGRLVLAGLVNSSRPIPVLARVLLEASPTGIAFTPVANAAISTDVTSNAATPGGFAGSVPISVVDGAYSLGCNPAGFTTVPGTLVAGASVCVRHRTSFLPGDSVTTTLYLGTTSATFTSTTGKAVAALALASSANPSPIEAPVTFTATVTGAFGTPSGLVTFRDGATVLGAVSADASGTARITTSSLVAGSHAINATYAGNATYGIAGGSLTQAVMGNALVIAIATPVPSVTYGSAVGFTVTLTPAPGDGTLVVFKDGGNAIGIGTVSGTTAAFQTRELGVGSHPVTASFVPSGLYGAASSTAAVVTVNPAASATSLASSAAVGDLGAPVTFTALVSGGGYAFGGAIAFRDGPAAIPACAAVRVVNQLATCTTAGLAHGAHAITAAYLGDGNNLPSTSGVFPLEVAFDPAADADADAMPNGVEIAEGRNPLAKDNDVFGNARLFAMQQYRDFLSREGDTGGIAYWIAQLAGPQTRAQAIQGFFNSPEFQGVIAPVARLYFANFLRYPDYVGLQFHVARSRTGTALDVIANDFATSPEFVARYGALTNDAFIELVYQNVLGRPSDPVGKAYWLAQMAGGATRGQVMLGFSESPEYVAAIGNEVFITMMYVGMLKRAPDAVGFPYWLAQLDGGTSSLALTQGFLDAPEYHGRFLP